MTLRDERQGEGVDLEVPRPSARFIVEATSSVPPRRPAGLGVVFTRGAEHVVRNADDAFCALTGQSAAVVIGRPLADVLALTVPQVDWLDEVLESGAPAVMAELQLPRTMLTGETRYVTAIASPAVSEGAGASDAPGLLVQVVDTTAQVLARLAHEEAAREARLVNEALLVAGLREHERVEVAEDEAARWNALVANLTEGVTVVDAVGSTILVNPVGRRLLGLRDGTIDSKPSYLLETLTGERLAPSQYPAARALAGERFTDEEIVVERADHTRRRLLFSGSSVQDADGRVALAVTVFRDVTELRQLEQTREDYVALVTHDLRSPLQALLGYGHLLLRLEPSVGSEAAPRLASSAQMILKITQRLAAMVDELYQSSRLESGNLELDMQVTNIGALVAELCDRLGGPEDRARIRVTLNHELPLVHVDPPRIERAIANMITNALKYSPPTTAVRIGFDVRPGAVSVLVHDEGQGIAAPELPFVFDKYRRADRGSRREGLGLGLYIARSIVEAHGGGVGVESVVGRGSTFRVTLPVANAEHDER